MTRLNLILFFALIFSSLGLVNSQYKARKLYIELDQLDQAAKQYDQEYGQLQLEQSTWAMHSRIELVASQVLQMRVPDSKRIQIVALGNKDQAVPLANVVPASAALNKPEVSKSEVSKPEAPKPAKAPGAQP